MSERSILQRYAGRRLKLLPKRDGDFSQHCSMLETMAVTSKFWEKVESKTFYSGKISFRNKNDKKKYPSGIGGQTTHTNSSLVVRKITH